MANASVGSICYSIRRGLGNLCRDFYRNGIIDEVCIVKHSGIPMQTDWYPNAPIYDPRHPEPGVLRQFADRHQTLLFFETPFDWSIITYCKAKGIKTVLVTMYECHPANLDPLQVPDLWVCPSLLDVEYFAREVDGKKQWTREQVVKYAKQFDRWPGWGGNLCTFAELPCEYPFRRRERALHFVHNGGYLGVRGREGTENLIRAMKHVKSPIRLTIRVQENVSAEGQLLCAADDRIEYLAESLPREQLYLEGDVAVGAQKWNGCSLPLTEAFCSGMLVMNTDRFPMNSWLPNEPLIPVKEYVSGRIAGRFLEFAEAVVEPEAIAAKIDEWYGREIGEFSDRGQAWAKKISWASLKSGWLDLVGKRNG